MTKQIVCSGGMFEKISERTLRTPKTNNCFQKVAQKGAAMQIELFLVNDCFTFLKWFLETSHFDYL